MALPGYLGQGFLSLYGIGTDTSWAGVVAPPGFLFSTVEQIWDGNSINAQVGTLVLYKEADKVCQLAYDNAVHVIMPVDKVIFTENFPT